MSLKLIKNQLIRRTYPFVDILMSRKSWPEAHATPYEIIRCAKKKNQNICLKLMLSTLWAISTDNILMVLFYIFFQKTEFDIPCKLSPVETICMKCQILLAGENRKWRLLKIDA